MVSKWVVCFLEQQNTHLGINTLRQDDCVLCDFVYRTLHFSQKGICGLSLKRIKITALKWDYLLTKAVLGAECSNFSRLSPFVFFRSAPAGIESCPEQQSADKSASLHDWEQFRTIFQVSETKAHRTEDPGIEPQTLKLVDNTLYQLN